MADIKISELAALTTPADADLSVIVDDSEAVSEKTKKITWANLKLALTGVAATYGTTGAYTASMPTNGVAAAAKIMLGDSNTIIWMYLNAAPPGWKVITTGADSVLGVAGGSASFNVAGGNPDSAAVWPITGLSHSHTHAGPSHAHDLNSHTHGAGSFTVNTYHRHDGDPDNTGGRFTLSGNRYTAYAGSSAQGVAGTSAAASGNTAAGGTGSTGDASVTGVTSSGAWRPKASIGKLFQLDTA